MKEEEKVLEAIKKLGREEFEDFCLSCLKKLGMNISNFKAKKDWIMAEGTVEMNGETKDYIIKFTRSVEKNSVDDLKRSLSPSTQGLFLSPEKIGNQSVSHESIEVVEGDKLYRLLEKFNLISKFDLLKDEDPTQGLREKGEFFLRQDKYEKAIDLLERAVDMDEDMAEGWLLLGKAYYLNDQKKEALKAYDRAADLQPDDIDILKRRGRLLYELKKYDEAILCFEDILEIDPESKEAWNNKALCHMRNSEYEESLDSIEKALSIDPEFEDALLNKALIFENVGEIKRALGAIEGLLEDVPKKAEYNYIRAAYLVSLERFEEGREAIMKTLRLDPEHEGARRLKSRLDKNFR